MFYWWIIWMINAVPHENSATSNYTWDVADGIGEDGREVDVRVLDYPRL